MTVYNTKKQDTAYTLGKHTPSSHEDGDLQGRAVKPVTQGGNEQRYVALSTLGAIATVPAELSAARRAYTIGDRTTFIHSVAKAIQKTLQSPGSIASIGSMSITASAYFKIFKASTAAAKPFAFSAAALGLVVSVIEGSLESYRLYRMVNFRTRKCPLELQQLEKELKTALQTRDISVKGPQIQGILTQLLAKNLTPQTRERVRHFVNLDNLTLEDCKNFKKTVIKPLKREIYQDILKQLYLPLYTITDEKKAEIAHQVNNTPGKTKAEKKDLIKKLTCEAVEKKHNWLSRRLESAFIEKLEKQAPGLIKDLTSGSHRVRKNALIEAEKLITLIQTHAEKKIVTHKVGVITTAIVTFSLILAFFTLPIGWIVAISLFALASCYVRSWMYLGWVHTEGWSEVKPENFCYHFVLHPAQTAIDVGSCIAKPIKAVLRSLPSD